MTTEHKCSVCQCEFTDDEGGIHGLFGIIPVSFCPTCFCCMCDMAEQLNDREWEGLTDEEIDGMVEITDLSGAYYYDDLLALARAIEARLKEKNT